MNKKLKKKGSCKFNKINERIKRLMYKTCDRFATLYLFTNPLHKRLC